MTPLAISAVLRTALDATGLPLSERDVQIALREAAPGIASSAAETVMLSLAGCGDPGQDTFNRILDATLGLLGDMLKACLAEYGHADEGEVEAIVASARGALLERLHALSSAMSMEGRA